MSIVFFVSHSTRLVITSSFLNSARQPVVLTDMLIPNRLLLVSALALVLAITLQAQTAISGKWRGTTRNGMQVLLSLKADGGALTGSVTGDGETSPITQGKVSSSTIRFNAVLGDQNEALTGELDGEQLKVWLDRQGRDGAVVFARVRE
jgi:hypothetical protein